MIRKGEVPRMNFVKANKLKCRADIGQRGVCRAVWVTVPGLTMALVFALFGNRQLLSIYYLSFVIGMPVLGVVVDAIRLRNGRGDR
jgi:hypothetical protein